jgi:hypothetical protein
MSALSWKKLYEDFHFKFFHKDSKKTAIGAKTPVQIRAAPPLHSCVIKQFVHSLIFVIKKWGLFVPW